MIFGFASGTVVCLVLWVAFHVYQISKPFEIIFVFGALSAFLIFEWLLHRCDCH